MSNSMLLLARNMRGGRGVFRTQELVAKPSLVARVVSHVERLCHVGRSRRRALHLRSHRAVHCVYLASFACLVWSGRGVDGGGTFAHSSRVIFHSNLVLRHAQPTRRTGTGWQDTTATNLNQVIYGPSHRHRHHRVLLRVCRHRPLKPGVWLPLRCLTWP